ncbi:MAG TPA: sugar phosphate isomerase/epimerase family protein [Dehalococcoidia bacterium]|nr:sugar phosphate isomerase/epimerase family protein [Dehalococcoidia bacterium]
MPDPRFQLSLAAWSVHRMFRDRQIDQLGMVDLCHQMGIGGLEMVNTFFPSPQYAYLKQLRKRADDAGVKLLLIMCDGEGSMAGPERASRLQAAKNHHKWVDVAAVLGCHSIRCNTGAQDGDPDALDRCAESFAALVEYADAAGVNVLIENHWGLSSDPAWLMALMDRVGHPRFGTLPDFGNFPDTIDRYDAVARMMPRAKAVSAKCYDFDAAGDETKIDFARMMAIVGEAGYTDYVGIEYEGERLPEREGILACKALLERYR